MHVRQAAAALALLAGAAAIRGVPAARAQDAFPPVAATYASSELAARAPAAAPEAPRFSLQPDAPQGADAAAPQSYWPVLYSLLIPGTGEIAMGYYKRGIFLVAMEVVAWTGYYINHSDGMDERDAYESFADANWTEQKWIDDHPCSTLPPSGRTLEDLEECGEASSGSGAWPGYVPYVSKEEDKQHYYENLGKYDWYISGWDDWDPAANPYAHETALRDEYRAMRQTSNESLDDANAFIWVSVAARVYSLAETAIIVHNRREATGTGGEDGGMALRARPRGFEGGELALEVRF